MGELDFNCGHNIKQDDAPTYDRACMGLLVCPHCGKAVMCGDIQPAVAVQIDATGEQDNMWKSPNNSGNNRQQRQQTGFRYLNASMLSFVHQLATIDDARIEEDKYRKGEEVLNLKIKFKGEFILWPLRNGNPCLGVILAELGDDETRFKGAELELFIEEDAFDGKRQIRVEVKQVAPASKKSK
jgi:hypothetical protein